MRKAFSLIEVVVATVIIALVGLALLQMGTKHLKMDAYIEKKSAVAQYSSIISFHHNTDYNKLKKSLYDFLKDDYVIDNLEIKQMLDTITFEYTETKITSINFGENNETLEDKSLQSFDLKKATIKNSDITSSLYFLEY